MICPLCHSQMIKVHARAHGGRPEQIRCLDCRFVIFYRGLRAKPEPVPAAEEPR